MSTRHDETTSKGKARFARRRLGVAIGVALMVLFVGLGVVTVYGQDIRHHMGHSTVCHVGETAVQAKQRSGVEKASTRKVLKEFPTDANF